MSLHDSLHRIADRAPLAHPDPELAWRTGRRRHHRRTASTVLAAVAAVAAAAVLAGLVGWLPGRDEPPVATSASLGVPDHVYDVPVRFEERDDDGTWSSDEVSGDLAPGRGAAAFVTSGGLPVVIGAADGAYHLLDLPGFLGNERFVALGQRGDELSVALSPDGGSLAYGWAEVRADVDTEPVRSGVRIVDLEDGSLRTIEIPGLEGTQAVRFAWSPDGEWLVWSGYQLGEWTTTSMAQFTEAAGRIAPGATTSEPVEEYGSRDVNSRDAVAVGNQGRVLLVATGGGDPGRRGFVFRTVIGQALGTDPTVSADGRVVVGGRPVRQVAFTVADTGRRAALVPSTPRTQRVVPPREDGVVTEALGWVGEAALVRTTPFRSADGRSRLLLVGPSISAYEVAVVDGSPVTLTVATDLMTLQRPTVSRPAPDWPWSTERWVAALLLAAAALVLVAAAALALRRRLRGDVRAVPAIGAVPGLVGGALAGAGAVVLLGLLGLLTAGDDLALASAALVVALGLALSSSRLWRWVGIGVALGAPLTYAGLGLLLLVTLGS